MHYDDMGNRRCLLAAVGDGHRDVFSLLASAGTSNDLHISFRGDMQCRLALPPFNNLEDQDSSGNDGASPSGQVGCRQLSEYWNCHLTPC